MTLSQRARLPPFAVARPQLTARLDQLGGGEVGAIIAPAGSGKSVLATQWAEQQQEIAVASVDLTRSSSDPVVFARQLVEAVSVPVPAALDEFSDLFREGGGFPGEEFLDRMLAMLETIDRKLALLFDDVERIGALDAPAQMLDGLLDRLPVTTRAIVVGRWDPPISFHRWRVEGRLHELRGPDLAFDEDETEDLVRRVAGIDLDGASLRTLVDRTDGWPAGIQLAAISIGRATDPDRFIREFAGTDVHVAQYLVEEVLRGLDESVRSFLGQTSVLPWLGVDFCSYVLEAVERDEIEKTLEYLVGHGFFLVPVDEHGDRVRYHKLFADLLRHDLRRREPDRERRLRRRAVEWLLEHGYLSDAAEEMVESGDVDGVIRLVRENGRRYYERNEAATLARWLTAARDAAPDPPAEVEIHLLGAQFACHQVSAATDTSRRLRQRSDLTRGERAEAEAIHALLGLHDLSPTEIERAATRALELAESLRPGDCYRVIGVGAEGMVELFAWFMRGHAAFFEGDSERALEMFDRALRTREADYPAWKVNILGGMALVSAWRGHLTTAESLASAAIATAHEALTPRYVGLAYAHQATALVALTRLDTKTARSHLQESGPITERSYRPPLLAMQRLLRAGVLAEEDGASAGLNGLERVAPPAIQPRVIDAAACSLHGRLLIAAGRAAEARSLFGSFPSARGTPAVRIDLALALDDCLTARRELEVWQPPPADLSSVVGRRVREAAVTWRTGSRAAALRSLGDALSLAATEGLKLPFVEVPAALALLRSEPSLHATAFARSVLTVADAVYMRGAERDPLADPLTDRELEVLALLPSRLSNSDLAASLFISVNTLKTHLRHIYVKLDAGDRDRAIERAATLGLL